MLLMKDIVFAEKPSNPQFRDYTGSKFNHLTVIGYAGLVGKNQYWYCRCDCGNISRTNTSKLRSGRSKSCGCMVAVWASERTKTHGHTCGENKRLYGIWRRMLRRCSAESDGGWPNYGGRGIKVCDRWKKFESFLADMGTPEKGMGIDRIDNDGDYCPENCRWADLETQGSNKRNNAMVEYMGESMTVTQLAKRHNLPVNLVFARLGRGWSPGDAILPETVSSRGKSGKYARRRHVPESLAEMIEALGL